MYHTGDYVLLTDLPQRPLCRVATADTARARGGRFQILTLEPLEGPWLAWPGTNLVRVDDAVAPAHARDFWRAGRRGRARHRMGRGGAHATRPKGRTS